MKKFVGTWPKKQVECEKCGFVNEQPKVYPLKLSCCKTCGSTRIRLYKPRSKP